jgi:hypothetical protein
MTKKEAPKGDFTSTKGIENNGSSSGETTPEITARTRQSLEEYSANMQDDKDQQIEMMNEQFTNQQQELMALREALRNSLEE